MVAAFIARNALLPWSRAAADPDAPCVADSARRLCNREFRDTVEAMAERLSSCGLGSGDTVAVRLPNCVEHVVTAFAAWRLGAVLTPVDPASSQEQALHQLEDAGAVLLVAPEADRVLATRARAVFVERASVLIPDPTASRLQPATTAPDDFAVALYASPPAQRSLGVLLDHSNLAAMSDAVIDRLGLSCVDRSLLLLPISTCDGMVVSMLSALIAGGDVVMATDADVFEVLHLMNQHRPTFFCAPPEAYRELASAPAGTLMYLPSVRFAVCTSEPLPREVRDCFEERAGLVVVEGWSVPEVTGLVTLNPVEGRRKAGTAGLPLLGHDVRVMDAQETSLPTGGIGEVVVRGRGVMRGYLGQPAMTLEVLHDGWLRTGAVGCIDEDGHLVLVGRCEDVLLRGEQYVHPAELEAVLRRHEAVREVLVTGRPDPVLGEVAVAHVVLRDDRTTTSAELLLHCRENLDRYKVPDAIHVATALPAPRAGREVDLTALEPEPVVSG
jgi:long-chain acyl-CoA synthetase